MATSVQDVKLNPGWEKFFMLLLIINPLFDLYSGIYLNIATNIVGEKVTDLLTPTLIVRMLILLVFATYVLLLRDKKSILTVSAIGVAFVMSVLGEFLFAEQFSLFADLNYIAKFTYNVAVILIYWRVFQRLGWDKERLLKWLNWLFSFTSLVLSGSILIAYATRQGFYTYGDRFGFRGSRGFFYSGNDITAVLMVLLPLCFVTYMLLEKDRDRWHKLFYLLAPATALCSLFLIGTKTAYAAILAVVFTFLINAIMHNKKHHDKSRLKSVGWVMLASAVVFGVMSALSAAAMWLEFKGQIKTLIDIFTEQGFLDSLISGRGDKFKAAFADYKNGGPYAWIFGVGRGTQELVIEMDIPEVLAYYGLFGLVTMLFLYMKMGVGFLRKFKDQVDLYSVACFLSIGLCAGYLVIAGHVLFSVTSGFYFAFMLLYAHLYLSDSPQEVQVL